MQVTTQNTGCPALDACAQEVGRIIGHSRHAGLAWAVDGGTFAPVAWASSRPQARTTPDLP